MANVNSPFGFQQVSGLGSVPTYEMVTLKIASSNSTAIFYGDAVQPVNSSATGYIKQAAVDTVALAGVFYGCKYTSTAQKRTVWGNYWPGSDATGDVDAYVVNDPNAQFRVQVATTAVAFAKIGQNVAIVVGTGNTNNGISGMTVNSTPATTATLPFRIVNVVTDPPGTNGTDQTTSYNQVIVAFNNVLTRSNGAQTGIS